MSEPIISPWVFFLINLLSNLDGIALVCIILCGIAAAILGLVSNEKENEQ